MKKKFLIGLLTIVMCFALVGCGSNTEEKGNTEQGNKNEEKNETSSEKSITADAKTSAANYKIDLEKMGIEYEVIDGYYYDTNNHLELKVYLNKTFEKDDKIALHNSLVDYFKTIADENKVYNLYLDEEYDKADTEASGIWIRAKIDGKMCKIYFGGHAPISYAGKDYAESYRITIDPEA